MANSADQQNSVWPLKRDFILASGSPARLKLLHNAGFFPKKIAPCDIDESVGLREKPSVYVRRMALEKALAAAKKHPDSVILSADTVIVVGQRIIRKAADESEALAHLNLISGRSHKVLTAFCVIDPQGKKPLVRLVTTRVLIKHLSDLEKKSLIACGEWRHVAGYSVEGYLSCVVKKMIGSYPNVVGLPIYDVAKDLIRILS